MKLIEHRLPTSCRILAAVLVSLVVAGTAGSAGAEDAPAAASDRGIFQPVGLYHTDRLDDVITADDCLDSVPNDCSLRGALLRANQDGVGSTVVLMSGTYELTVDGANEDFGTTGDLDLVESQSLHLTAPPDARPVIEQLTVDRIFHVHPSAGAVTFQGPMTLRGGTAVDAGGFDTGGSINFFRGASLVLRQVDLVGGSAEDAGGCLSWSAPTSPGSLELTDVTFSRCHTDDDGGGFLIQSADSSVVFDRVTVRDNVAGQEGGGGTLFPGSATVVIQRSSFENNEAGAAALDLSLGGGLLIGSGSISIHESTFAYNKVGQSGNPSAWGGGIFAQNALVLLRNSTLSQNQAVADSLALGADLMAQNSVLAFEFVTLKAHEPATVASVSLGSSSDLDIFASIIQGSCANPGTFTSQGFNVERPIGGATSTGCNLTHPGDVLTNQDLLQTLAGRGGPTKTHALLPAGEAAAFLVSSTACADTDQRGAARLGLFCYSGAYEANVEAPGNWMFCDGFESGDLTAWSAVGP
ncbi:MAG: right-handed parallel beta-helix repeat-containing protein [Acidobacteria bacterium]|nr:right-handed parallel beta-helix repeat-containing protein [Acidobacteriota bacterium]